MIILADSGSTKCDWTIVDEDNSVFKSFRTIGLNPLILSRNQIKDVLMKTADLKLNKSLINEIFFFGAGCENPDGGKRIREGLSEFFGKQVRIQVKGDIDAAVLAATSSPGLVCIMGTGSNCCFFDGTKVIQKSPSLGYLLGDEGSGNAIGRTLLKDFYFDKMPEALQDKFVESFETDLDKVLGELYSHSYPNKYLAAFAKFAFDNLHYPYMYGLVKDHTVSFFDLNFPYYRKEVKKFPIHFVGSIGYYSKGIIKKELFKRGLEPGNFIKSPIENLIKSKYLIKS